MNKMANQASGQVSGQAGLKKVTDGWYSAEVVSLTWHKTKSDKDRAVIKFKFSPEYESVFAYRGRVINDGDYTKLDEDIKRCGAAPDAQDLPGKRVRVLVKQTEYGLEVESISAGGGDGASTNKTAEDRFKARFRTSAQTQVRTQTPAKSPEPEQHEDYDWPEGRE